MSYLSEKIASRYILSGSNEEKRVKQAARVISAFLNRRRKKASLREKMRAFKKKRNEHREGDFLTGTTSAASDVFDFIGRGGEAFVYEINDDKVLKVSKYGENLRGEYVIFSDPQFHDITPDVYGHADDWMWMIVEQVNPLSPHSWERLYDHFPTLEYEITRMSELDESKSSHRASLINDLFECLGVKDERGSDRTLGSDRFLTEDEAKDVWNKMRTREKDWFQKVADLHRALGMEVSDIRPENLGEDNDRRLVLLDVHIKRNL